MTFQKRSIAVCPGSVTSSTQIAEVKRLIRLVKQLRDLGVKISVVSNADPRIREPSLDDVKHTPLKNAVRTLESLSILPLLSHPPILSWDVESSKPSSEIYQAACKACDEDPGEGVMMVGDELKAYVSPVQVPDGGDTGRCRMLIESGIIKVPMLPGLKLGWSGGRENGVTGHRERPMKTWRV